MKFSVSLRNYFSIENVLSAIGTIEHSQYSNLVIPDERLQKNPYSLLTVAAMQSSRIGLLTVTNPYTRHPALTAAAACTVNEISDDRFTLGMGAGGIVLKPLGIERSAPIRTVSAAVDVIRRLQAGERVKEIQDEFEIHDAGLDFTPTGELPVYIAGRGPQLLRLAGRIGDGAIVGGGLVSADGMAYAHDRLREGANAVGRDLDSLEVICWALLSVATDREVALDRLRPSVAQYVQSVPLETLERIGVDPANARRIRDVADIDRLSSEMLRDIVNRDIVEQFSIVGTPAQCRMRVERLERNGVSHLALLPFENEEFGYVDMLDVFSREVI